MSWVTHGVLGTIVIVPVGLPNGRQYALIAIGPISNEHLWSVKLVWREGKGVLVVLVVVMWGPTGCAFSFVGVEIRYVLDRNRLLPESVKFIIKRLCDGHLVGRWVQRAKVVCRRGISGESHHGNEDDAPRKTKTALNNLLLSSPCNSCLKFDGQRFDEHTGGTDKETGRVAGIPGLRFVIWSLMCWRMLSIDGSSRATSPSLK